MAACMKHLGVKCPDGGAVGEANCNQCAIDQLVEDGWDPQDAAAHARRSTSTRLPSGTHSVIRLTDPAPGMGAVIY